MKFKVVAEGKTYFAFRIGSNRCHLALARREQILCRDSRTSSDWTHAKGDPLESGEVFVPVRGFTLEKADNQIQLCATCLICIQIEQGSYDDRDDDPAAPFCPGWRPTW